MKRGIAVVLLLLVGLGILLYPTLSNYLFEQNGSKVVDSYNESVAATDETMLKAAWAKAEEYNRSLTGQPVRDPFLAGSGIAMPDGYANILNVDGVMGYVEIPKIGVNLPVYHGTSETVLQKGIGHLEGTTLPIGGEGRHAVLTGHTGLPSARLFSDLSELKTGDMFYFHVLGEILAYRVDQIKVIEPQFTDELKRFEGKDYLTLLTCTPYGIGSHRLLVRGERVQYLPEVADNIQQVGSSVDNQVLLAAAITAAVMLPLILVVAIRNRRRKDEAKLTSASESPAVRTDVGESDAAEH